MTIRQKFVVPLHRAARALCVLLLFPAAFVAAQMPRSPSAAPLPPELPAAAPAGPASAKTYGPVATPPTSDCGACGRVESIRQTIERQQWTPLGTGVGVAGAPSSPGEAPAGVTSFKIGPGMSNQGIVVLGAAGGAAYSRTPTAYERPRWEVTVKLDNGAVRVVAMSYEPYVREGDRVRVAGNNVELLDE